MINVGLADIREDDDIEAAVDALLDNLGITESNDYQRLLDYDHKFSSTQIDLPPEIAGKMRDWVATNIADEEFSPDEQHDGQYHVTVKYGLHDDTGKSLRDLLGDFGPVELTLGYIGIFSNNPLYDVLIVSVDSPALIRLNKVITDEMAHTNTQDSYVPHVTLAYLKKGVGNKWIGKTVFAGMTAHVEKITFSSASDAIGMLDIPISNIEEMSENNSSKKFHLEGQHDQQTHNPYLGQEKKAELETKYLTARAKNIEPLTTKVLESSVFNLGGKLEGLQHKVKSDESLERKIKQRVEENPGLTPTDVALGISDALRYTAVFPDNEYSKGVKTTLNTLGAAGYSVDKLKNYWGPGDNYDGINVAMRSADGLKVELQFHTPDGFRVKEKESHPIYEKLRTTKSPREAKEYKDQLRSIWHAVTVPAGASSIGTWMSM